MSADFFEASKLSRTTLKRQCLKPLAEWHDLNAELLLCAFQIEHELQRFFGPQFPRIVVERASDGAVGSLHFNQPLHSPVSCDDEIDFPALFVAQVVELPILARGVLPELCVFQQAASHEVLELCAAGLIIRGSAIIEEDPSILANAARKTARVGRQQKHHIQLFE